MPDKEITDTERLDFMIKNKDLQITRPYHEYPSGLEENWEYFVILKDNCFESVGSGKTPRDAIDSAIKCRGKQAEEKNPETDKKDTKRLSFFINTCNLNISSWVIRINQNERIYYIYSWHSDMFQNDGIKTIGKGKTPRDALDNAMRGNDGE